MVERVRWQLDAWVDLPRGSDQEITGGIVLIRLVPEEVRADVGQQLGLWGGQSDADRRAIRAIARLTTLTSETAVTVPVWRGGRLPGDRYRWVPATTVDLDQSTRMASRASTGSGPSGPWPGSLPTPSPATVLRRPSSRRGARRAGPGGRGERPRCGVGPAGEPDDHARRRVGGLATWTTTGDHGVGRAVADRPALVGTEPAPASGAVPDAHRSR